MNKYEKKSQKKELIRKIILGVAVAGLLICLICIAVHVVRNRHAEEVYAKLQQESVVNGLNTQPPGSDAEEEIPEQEEPHIYEEMPVVDFTSLWETNTDICAWIYIPGTEVNYPVLRNAAATDPHDSYYLDHTVDRMSGLPGAIYIEPCNMGDFSDRNTVLYGHHMKNGSMFASLDQFQDNLFMDGHPYVYVVTPEQNMVYEVYAAIVYDNRHIMGSYDFESDSSYQAFLDSLVSNRNMADVFSDAVEVTTESRLITLSTCVKNQDENRLLVIASLTDTYERQE